MRIRILCLTALLALAAACGDDGGDDDGVTTDGGIGIDADPNAPDADPNAPDADPNAPDAGPLTCDPGLERCDGRCVDLMSDDGACGDCDTACDPGESCVVGGCVAGVGALVISELHAQQPAYIELYNGGATAIDLASHQIQWNTDGDATGSVVLPSYSLAPETFVVLREGSGTDEAGVIHLGESVGWSDHAAVRLLAPGGIGIDFVRTGASAVPPPTGTAWTGDNTANPGANVDQSLIRNVFAADTDTAADWSLIGPGSPGVYCGIPGRCGDRCVDQASDRDNCGDCGVTCGATQLCVDGDCRTGASGLWISEYRRFPRPGVEIHNPTPDAFSLQNYRLDISGPTNLTYTFPAFTLEPGAFVFVYMGDGEADDTSLYTGPSAAFGPNIAIALYDDGTTPFDFVRFGSSTAPVPSGTDWFGANVAAPPMDADVGARRNLETLDTDGPADWVTDSPSTPGFACHAGLTVCDGGCVAIAEDPLHCGGCGIACGANETCTSGVCSTSGAVVLSELRNGSTEAIEVFNGTADTVDLSGWQLTWVADTSGSFTVPDGVTLPAGGFLVFFESSGTDTATRVFMNTTISWNDVIAVSLEDDAGAGIDFVRTGSSVTMPPSGTAWVGDNTTNPGNVSTESLRRQVYAPDTDTAADWSVASPVSLERFCADADESVCGGDCADLDTDPAHCGDCGNTCGNGATCFAGRCVHDGAIRLSPISGSNGVTVGRVDVFDGNVWKLLISLDDTDVAVACRQIGFSGGSASGSLSSTCSDCGGRLFSFTCTGSEPRLLDCPHSGDNFSSSGTRAICTP